MLEVAQAQERIYRAIEPGPCEWVTLGEAAGRALARDVAAKRDQPPKAMSSMDGYALRAVDAKGELRIVGEVPAGAAFARIIGPGEAARIFTGSVVPQGADAVLIQEDALVDGDRLRAKAAVREGENVRRAGLDFAAGWVGLRAGTLLDPRAVGLAASMGHAFLEVRRRPLVALIATGDELRWPGETPEPQQIVSSNTPMLTGLVRLWGGTPVDLGIAADRPEALHEALDQARGCDLIVTTGGASVGDYDLVQQVAGSAGMTLDFWKIRMRPGRPLIFGSIGGRPLIGLPGNPVSAAVCAIMFLRGALLSRLGRDPTLSITTAPLGEDLPQGGDRRDFMRGFRINAAGAVSAHSRQDSSMLATFAAADVLIVRPPGDSPRKAGDQVEIIDLRRLLQPGC